MAKKKTRRRADAGQERDHLGCMWGFMNMFTFRHGPLSHKLLFEPKHGSCIITQLHFLFFFWFFITFERVFFFFLWLTVVLIVPSAAGSPRNNELDKSKCRGKGPEETHVSF